VIIIGCGQSLKILWQRWNFIYAISRFCLG